VQTIRLFVFTLLAILTIIFSASAQNQSLDPKLREGDLASDSLAVAPSAIRPIILPEKAAAPARVKVIDKKFIAVMAALAGSETLRYTTHKLVLDHEYAAGAPWVTSVPDNRHLVGKFGGLFAAELLVAYELKKPHSWLPGDKYIRKFWWAYPAVMTTIHIKNGVRSIRTQPPAEADCPPEYAQYCGQ
jgi:hypothetical protein